MSFINAGAELVETNTFGGTGESSPPITWTRARGINGAGWLARQARETTGRVSSSAARSGQSVSPSHHASGDLFAEQAEVLDGRGADLFMLETFYDLDELADAIEAVRTVSALPIVALLTFDEGAETLSGVTAREAAERLSQLDVAAIGANHGAGLLAALTALEQMQADGRALAALPNIGLASMSGGRVIYPHATPDYFAEFAAHARELGARIIGGCCGTTPTEIAAIRAAIEERSSPARDSSRASAEPSSRSAKSSARRGLPVRCAKASSSSSIQLDPPLGGLSGGVARSRCCARGVGKVQFVDVNDNATARAG